MTTSGYLCCNTTSLAPLQDPFKYSYPPLPDDDFQTPLCENGPIVSEDETESKEGELESKETLESSFNSEVAVKPKKVQIEMLKALLPHENIHLHDLKDTVGEDLVFD